MIFGKISYTSCQNEKVMVPSVCNCETSKDIVLRRVITYVANREWARYVRTTAAER
jgi:hypothetical protein